MTAPTNDRSPYRRAATAAGAWVLGMSGTVLAVRGYGPLAVSDPVQRDALLSLGVVTAIWSAGMFVLAAEHRLARRLPTMVVASGVLVVVCAAVGRPNAGRTVGIVAGISVALATASVAIPWPAAEPAAPRPRVAVLPLAILVAAQVLWGTATELTLTLVLLAATGSALLAYLVAPSQLGGVQTLLGRWLAAAADRGTPGPPEIAPVTGSTANDSLRPTHRRSPAVLLGRHLLRLTGSTITYGVTARRISVLAAVAIGGLVIALAVGTTTAAPFVVYPFI